MTLDVENCHSTVHHKQGNMSMAEYCRSFGEAMKEAVKRVTSWAAFYHTSRQSWYPSPEGAFAAVAGSVHETSRKTSICAQLTAMHSGDWASSYGAAVRTTYCTPKDHYGSTWETPRVYASKAMRSRRENQSLLLLTHRSVQQKLSQKMKRWKKQKTSLTKVVTKKSIMIRRFPR